MTNNSPKFAEKYANNDLDGMGKTAMQSAKLIFWTTIPLATILLIFPKFFMGLYGTDFVYSPLILGAGFEALRWLIIGRIVNALSGSVGNLMQMSGQQKSFMNTLRIFNKIKIFGMLSRI